MSPETDEIIVKKKKKKKKKISLPRIHLQVTTKAIGLSECNNIRKKLNKQDKYAMDPGSQVHLNIKKI